VYYLILLFRLASLVSLSFAITAPN